MRKLTLIFFVIAMPFVLASCQTGKGNVEFAGRFNAKQISGILVKPEGNGPFPAMVLVHGCSGIRPNIYMWGRWFEEKAYVTLAPDSFGPRGVSEICTDFSRVSQALRYQDVYGAANFLATLPYVDKARIGIMGFSNGAGTALDAIARGRLALLDDNDQRFALPIPLYPECTWRTGPWYVPVMILIGEKDDWTPAGLCERLSAASVIVKVYEGAHHAFDGNSPLRFLPDVKNLHSSNRRGATIGSSRETTEAAKRDIEIFLNRYMSNAPGS